MFISAELAAVLPEEGDGALTWDKAPVKLLDDPAAPVSGELGRGMLQGVEAGDTLLLDVTDGLRAWLAQHPGAESVVVHLVSDRTAADGQKSVDVTSEEGAMLPERVPAMVYTVTTYPAAGTVILLK